MKSNKQNKRVQDVTPDSRKYDKDMPSDHMTVTLDDKLGMGRMLLGGVMFVVGSMCVGLVPFQIV